jgi:hypothetical protein
MSYVRVSGRVVFAVGKLSTADKWRPQKSSSFRRGNYRNEGCLGLKIWRRRFVYLGNKSRYNICNTVLLVSAGLTETTFTNPKNCTFGVLVKMLFFILKSSIGR